MTSEEIASRISTLNYYKNTLNNSRKFSVLHTTYETQIVEVEPDNYETITTETQTEIGGSNSFDYINAIYKGILNKSVPYGQSTYDLLISLAKNNSILFTINNGQVSIKKIHNVQYSQYYVENNDPESLETSYWERFRSDFRVVVDTNWQELSSYYEFQSVVKNPFLYSVSDVSGVKKGQYLQYNPPQIINKNSASGVSLIGYINLESRDNLLGSGANFTASDVVSSTVEDERARITPYIAPLENLIEEFLKSVILNTIEEDIDYLNSNETGIMTYGVSINHLFDWIEAEIGALTNTQTVRVDWQNRLSVINGDLSIQEDIAETFNLKSTLGTIEYGGDIDYSYLEFCFHFSDGLGSDELSPLAESLQIGTSQFITKADLKKKLKLGTLENIMIFATKEVSYSVSSTDEEGNISSSSVTKTVQVGYCTKALFGLTNTRFNDALNHCLSFNSKWNERCEFDKVVGIILIFVGMLSGNVILIETGYMILVIIKIILGVFLLSGKGSQKDRIWASAILSAIGIYGGGLSWESGANGAELTTAQLMTNLNISVMSANALSSLFIDIQQYKWDKDTEEAKGKMEEAQKTLDEMQSEFTNFYYNDFYNLYDDLYSSYLPNYDKIYTK